ncbi:hypothetical protein TREES_T100019196 [Tupaia chinensis]|uniref:Uncharacterized protein n=1 Tax=Tupaia chinensis TaxID=246437 RepID=L9L8V4_TUPCH|nr:hypothetical protein TREES_T100019196 [Tupaia chinensis]
MLQRHLCSNRGPRSSVLSQLPAVDAVRGCEVWGSCSHLVTTVNKDEDREGPQSPGLDTLAEPLSKPRTAHLDFTVK